MNLTFIKNESDWAALEPTILKRFNISYGAVRGHPNSYPFAVGLVPGPDLNSFGVSCVFFYVEDAKKLLALAESCDKMKEL